MIPATDTPPPGLGQNPQFTTALDNASIVLYRQGKQAEAEALEREVLVLRINILGKDHLQVAMSLLNLAAFLQAQGKLAEAETVSRQALAANRRAFGNEHQYVTTTLNNLACVFCLQGKLVVKGLMRLS
jgi:tetratricopeptide (TPR) repeat protein